MNWTEEEYKALIKQHAPKPSKYKNQRTVIDGEVFDSKKEAAYFQELKLREKAGEVRDIQRQMTFHLCAPVVDALMRQDSIPKIVYIADYVADFTFDERYHDVVSGERDTWLHVVADVKGTKNTGMFALKKKWLELQSGIRIREIR